MLSFATVSNKSKRSWGEKAWSPVAFALECEISIPMMCTMETKYESYWLLTILRLKVKTGSQIIFLYFLISYKIDLYRTVEKQEVQ